MNEEDYDSWWARIFLGVLIVAPIIILDWILSNERYY